MIASVPQNASFGAGPWVPMMALGMPGSPPEDSPEEEDLVLAIWNNQIALGVSSAEADRMVVAQSPQAVVAQGPLADVIVTSDRRSRARAAARVAARAEGRVIYVLRGYRPNRRGFRSRCYYVSRRAELEVPPDVLGGVFRPVLVCAVGPTDPELPS